MRMEMAACAWHITKSASAEAGLVAAKAILAGDQPGHGQSVVDSILDTLSINGEAPPEPVIRAAAFAAILAVLEEYLGVLGQLETLAAASATSASDASLPRGSL